MGWIPRTQSTTTATTIINSFLALLIVTYREAMEIGMDMCSMSVVCIDILESRLSEMIKAMSYVSGGKRRSTSQI